MTCRRLIASLLMLVLDCAALGAQQPVGLRVVVIEGEDGVNIIQQKTAVKPMVEVRDRNNLPVPGALVTFAIEGGKAASFGGASTLTVATNAAGQATVSGLTPNIAGAFHIQVSAAFQGQLATTTIAQTNVVTAAQAAAAAGTSGASGAGGGAGGGGASGAGAGGGLSTTTLVVAGAAVAGGAVAATQVVGKGGDESSKTAFTGSFSGTITSVVASRNNPGNTCTITRSVTGTATLKLDVNTPNSVSGQVEVTGSDTVVAQTCNGPISQAGGFVGKTTVNGSPSSFSGTEARTDTQTNPTGEVITSNATFTFQGSLSGNTVTGTIKHDEKSVSTGGGGGPVDEASSGTFPVTMTKS